MPHVCHPSPFFFVALKTSSYQLHKVIVGYCCQRLKLCLEWRQTAQECCNSNTQAGVESNGNIRGPTSYHRDQQNTSRVVWCVLYQVPTIEYRRCCSLSFCSGLLFVQYDICKAQTIQYTYPPRLFFCKHTDMKPSLSQTEYARSSIIRMKIN